MNLPFWRKKKKKGRIVVLYKLLKNQTVKGVCLEELFQRGWLLCQQRQQSNIDVWDFAESFKSSVTAQQFCVDATNGY